MAYYTLKGRANYDGAVGRRFEVTVESNDSNFTTYSKKMEDAVKALHPDWTSIIVEIGQRI